MEFPKFTSIEEFKIIVQNMKDAEIQSMTTLDWNKMYANMDKVVKNTLPKLYNNDMDIPQQLFARKVISKEGYDIIKANIDNPELFNNLIRTYIVSEICPEEFCKLNRNYRMEPEDLKVIMQHANHVGEKIAQNKEIDLAHQQMINLPKTDNEILKYSKEIGQIVDEEIAKEANLYNFFKNQNHEALYRTFLSKVEVIPNKILGKNDFVLEDGNKSKIILGLGDDGLISVAAHESAHAYLQTGSKLQRNAFLQNIPVLSLGQGIQHDLEYQKLLQNNEAYYLNPEIIERCGTNSLKDKNITAEEAKKIRYEYHKSYKRQPIEKQAHIIGAQVERCFRKNTNQLSERTAKDIINGIKENLYIRNSKGKINFQNKEIIVTWPKEKFEEINKTIEELETSIQQRIDLKIDKNGNTVLILPEKMSDIEQIQTMKEIFTKLKTQKLPHDMKYEKGDIVLKYPSNEQASLQELIDTFSSEQKAKIKLRQDMDGNVLLNIPQGYSIQKDISQKIQEDCVRKKNFKDALKKSSQYKEPEIKQPSVEIEKKVSEKTTVKLGTEVNRIATEEKQINKVIHKAAVANKKFDIAIDKTITTGSNYLNETAVGKVYKKAEDKFNQKVDEAFHKAKKIFPQKKVDENLIKRTKSRGMKKYLNKIGQSTVKFISSPAGKTIFKKVPLISAVFGGYCAAERFIKGDYIGGSGELCSGIAGCFPGLGSGISFALDGCLLAKDISNEKNKKMPNEHHVVKEKKISTQKLSAEIAEKTHKQLEESKVSGKVPYKMEKKESLEIHMFKKYSER